MKRIYVLTCIIGCVSVLSSAFADTSPALIGTFENWKSYSFLDNGQRVCFISSQPQKQEGKFKKRGEVFFFVTRWSGEKSRNVVSVSNGYSFKADTPVTVDIDGKGFHFFTQGEMAWTKDQAMDDIVVSALQKGAKIVVKGISSRGTSTTDTYSLKGVSAAYKAMTKECATKVKR